MIAASRPALSAWAIRQLNDAVFSSRWGLFPRGSFFSLSGSQLHRECRVCFQFHEVNMNPDGSNPVTIRQLPPPSVRNMETFELETTRLRFRQITAADADFIFELYDKDSFKRYIGDKNFQTLEDARAFIANSVVGMYKSSGLGLHLVELKHDATRIGICGLIKRDSLYDVDLGFGFLPAYEGRGYGCESARGFLSLAREGLKLPRVVAITTSDNTACIGLLAKLGFHFERVHEVLPRGVELGLYVLAFD
jgi:ribosomal-protein-alanine N-acetyltransferase